MSGFNGERVHALKAWPRFFADLVAGRKTFEIRRADRDYRVGDILYLLEWDPVSQQYWSGRAFRRVTYLADLGPIGCRGFVAMQLEHWSMPR